MASSRLMDFDMSIDLTAALSDEHLNDPDVSASVKPKNRVQAGRRSPAARPGLARAQSVRGSRRHLMGGGMGGGISGGMGNRMNKLGWASKLQSIGENLHNSFSSGSKVGMSFDDSFVALPEVRSLKVEDLRDDGLLPRSSSMGTGEDGGGSAAGGSLGSAQMSPSSRASMGGGGRARGRRSLLMRQPSIARRSSVARLVASTDNQLSELEAFLNMDDSQPITFNRSGDGDDSMTDCASDNTSLRDELDGLKDLEANIEETMRRELEGLWMSGAVDGWKAEDADAADDAVANEEEKKDEGDVEDDETSLKDWEFKAGGKSLSLALNDDADSAAISSLASSSIAGSTLSRRSGPTTSAAALAGGVSLARRRSSTALDLAGLDDFAADLERQWEEALLLEETIFRDDDDENEKENNNEGDDDDDDDAGANQQKQRGDASAFAFAGAGRRDEKMDMYKEQDEMRLSATLRTGNLRDSYGLKRLSTIESLNESSASLHASMNHGASMASLASLDEEAPQTPSPRPSPPLVSSKAVAYAPDMPTLTESIQSRDSSASRSFSSDLDLEKANARAAPPPARHNKPRGLLTRLLDVADKIAEVMYGRDELSFGSQKKKTPAAPVPAPAQTEDRRSDDAAADPNGDGGKLLATTTTTKTRQGAAILHLVLMAAVVRLLQGDVTPRIPPAKSGKVFWPCATLVPVATTALLEWSLPPGVEDVHVGAGLAAAAWIAERALLAT